MARVLHQAIQDAIRDAKGFEERSILVTAVLEATHDLDARETVLYQSVYTIFSAMPERLVRGSLFQVSTMDVENAVQLSWEAREEPTLMPAGQDVYRVMTYGPHGDLVGIALRALERFCQVRAGYLESRFQEVRNSSSFAQPDYIVRRVVAVIPCKPETLAAGQAIAEPQHPAELSVHRAPQGREARQRRPRRLRNWA